MHIENQLRRRVFSGNNCTIEWRHFLLRGILKIKKKLQMTFLWNIRKFKRISSTTMIYAFKFLIFHKSELKYKKRPSKDLRCNLRLTLKGHINAQCTTFFNWKFIHWFWINLECPNRRGLDCWTRYQKITSKWPSTSFYFSQLQTLDKGRVHHFKIFLNLWISVEKKHSDWFFSFFIF